MKFSQSLSFAASVLAVGYALGQAQAQMAPVIPPSQTQGPFAGQALGLQWSSENAAPSPATMRVRTAGLATGAPRAWSEERFGPMAANHPDYSPEALFGLWTPALFGEAGQWFPTFQPTLGDMSTGGDLTPDVDGDGKMLFGPSSVNWYTLSWTVAGDARGMDESAIRLTAPNASSAPEPANWVFTYVEEGGQRIHPQLVGKVSVEYTGAQSGVPSDADINALDWGVGMISVTGNAVPSTLQPHRNRFYFTLDRAWLQTTFTTPLPYVAEIPVVGGGFQSLLIDSACIYVMTWDGTQWSIPEVAMDAEALFGSAQSNVSIDGLSVDSGTGPLTIERVVFSLTAESRVSTQTQSNAVVDQILITQTQGVQVEAVPFKTQAGALVSARLGLVAAVGEIGPDDVDGLCGRDPRELRDFDVWVGTPAQVPGVDKSAEFGLTLARMLLPDGQGVPVEQLMLSAHGLDLSQWHLGVLWFRFDFPNVPFPLHAETVPFQVGEPTPYMFVDPSLTAFDVNFPFTKAKASHLRVYAELVGLHFGAAGIVQGPVGNSWATILGNH